MRATVITPRGRKRKELKICLHLINAVKRNEDTISDMLVDADDKTFDEICCGLLDGDDWVNRCPLVEELMLVCARNNNPASKLFE